MTKSRHGIAGIYCGSANPAKMDTVQHINHKEMKVKLHRSSQADDCFKVKMSEDGMLMIYFRQYGTSWVSAQYMLPERMREVITDYLKLHDDRGTYFIYRSEVRSLIDRLFKAKPEAVCGASNVESG